MKKAIILTIALSTFLSASAFAQMSAEVKFKPGDFGTMLSGTISGNEYFDYRLDANGGQELFVELTVDSTSGDGSAFFNILPPGSTGEAIYIGSIDEDKSTTVELPESGEYVIRIYLMGNDRDTGKTVGYKVDVSIQ